MQEPLIACPNCHTEIKLTESLAAPLIEATRQQYEKRSDLPKRLQRSWSFSGDLESFPSRTSCRRVHQMVRYGQDKRTKTLKTP